MTANSHLQVKRTKLPPVPVPRGELIDLWSTYATVSAGDISADVERFVLWDPLDGEPEAAVLFEVRINGLPETCGTADIVAAQPETLCDLASVCIHAVQLLNEARQQHATPPTTILAM